MFGLGPMDPLTLGAGGLLLALVAVVSAVFPARRAVNVSPILALRTE